MNTLKTFIVLSIGSIFAYISLGIAGYGAAVEIPTSVLLPALEASEFFTFATLDFIFLSLPMAFAYLFFAQLIKFFNINDYYFSYLILSLPFFILHVFIMTNTNYSSDFLYSFARTELPKFVLLAFCVCYMTKTRKPGNTPGAANRNGEAT